MIAKSPDYIITEFGCPQWKSEDEKRTEDLATLFKSYEIMNDANRRLLPLRETLTDYYSTTLAKLRLEASTESKRINITLGIRQTQRLVSIDPAKMKQLKMQRNEAVKMQQKHHQQPQEQQPPQHQEFQTHQKNSKNSTANNLDRSQQKRTTTTTTARRRRDRRSTTAAAATSDNDLDVF